MVMPLSVSWPANEPSFSASAMNGSQLRCFFRRDRREVHRVRDRAAQQIIRHLLGDLQRDILLRLGGRSAEVWRADDIGMTEQRVFLRRLFGEHVEGGAGDLTGIKRHAQRRFIDQPPARAIDDAHALPHRRERGRIDDVLRLLGERRVQRDEVGALEQLG